jgi:murein DD-endopeptidase MepM/ murein hydrolase activator NlpD
MKRPKPKEHSKEKLLSRLKNKYKLVFLNEQTYEEVFMLRLSRLNVFTYAGTAAMLIILVVTIIIAFTPLREYIPGYPTGKERRMIVRNAQRVDSLSIEINKRDKLLKNIRIIMEGGVIETGEREQTSESEKINEQSITFKKSQEDSLFRRSVEEEEKFSLGIPKKSKVDQQIESTFLFCPLKGIVVNKFGDSSGHYGVDIAAPEGSRVSAVMDGTVIFSGWTVDTGFVIQIQHSNNLISFYKHNSKLLKKTGTFVKAGEAIAQTGNSGELTTGPHLHFELWHKGIPLNPEDYISF